MNEREGPIGSLATSAHSQRNHGETMMQIAKRLLGLILVVAALQPVEVAAQVAGEPTSPSGYSNYGRVDSTAGGPIDLALGSKTFEEVDYSSAYPGLSVRRVNMIGSDRWAWDFDSIAIVGRGLYATVFLPSRKLVLRYDGTSDPAHGIYETLRYVSSDGAFQALRTGDSKYVLTDPATDTKTTYARVVGVLLPPVYGSSAFYRIESRKFRDGTTVFYDFDAPTLCSSLYVRHGPSGVHYRAVRSGGGGVGFPDACITQSVTLPEGTITYTWGTVPQPYGRYRSSLDYVSYPGGVAKRYTYQIYPDQQLPGYAAFGVATVTDEDGRPSATYAYDGLGRPTLSYQGTQAAPHNRISVSYPTATTRAVVDSDGVARTFTFASMAGLPRLVSVSAPCGSCAAPFKSIDYDATTGRPTRFVDHRDVVTTVGYDVADPRRREITRVVGAGTGAARTIQTTWHPSFNLPRRVVTTDSGGSYAEAMEYDAKGRPTVFHFSQTITRNGGSTQAVSRVITMAYVDHANGQTQKAIVNGPRDDVADVKEFLYDTAGRLIAVTDEMGYVTQFSNFDGHGRARAITHPNGTQTWRSYDWNGRLLSENANYITQSFTYYANGLLKTKTTPGAASQVLSYAYDDSRRPTSVQDNLGNRVEYTYDGMGRRTSVRTAGADGVSGTQTQTTYSNAGRTSVSTHFGLPGSLTTNLDVAYNVEIVFDPVGRWASQNRDALGRTWNYNYSSGLKAYKGYNVADGASTNHYHVSGGDDTMTQWFAYAADAKGLEWETTDADIGQDIRTFDASGNLISGSNSYGGPRWTTTYDNANRARRTSIKDPNSNAEVGFVQFEYDWNYNGLTPAPVGHLTQVLGSYGAAHFVYDLHGRMVQKAETRDALQFVDNYSFDVAGRVETITYHSGRQVWYQLDSLGRPVAVLTRANATAGWVTVASSIGYHPFGPVSTMAWGSGRVSGFARDSAGRITSYDDGARAVAVGYHNDGRTAQLSSAGAVLANYAYDGNGRIASATGQFGPAGAVRTVGYTFNNVGNLLTLNDGGTKAFAYPNNFSLVSAVGGQAYTYAQRGLVRSDGVNTLGYDARGHLTSAATPSGPYLYAYDHEGKRASKTAANGAKTYYLYDAGGRLIAETNGAQWQREYIWLGSRPVMMVVPASAGSAEQRYFVHVDHTETPVRLTNAAGATVWTWNRSPFGVEAPGGSVTFNLRMPGHYFDAETGYHYNWKRTYNPRTGRYLQPDPLGEAGGISAYTYAAGDPVGRVDPTGLESTVVASPTMVVTDTPSPHREGLPAFFNLFGRGGSSLQATSRGVSGGRSSGAVAEDCGNSENSMLEEVTDLAQDVLGLPQVQLVMLPGLASGAGSVVKAGVAAAGRNAAAGAMMGTTFSITSDMIAGRTQPNFTAIASSAGTGAFVGVGATAIGANTVAQALFRGTTWFAASTATQHAVSGRADFGVASSTAFAGVLLGNAGPFAKSLGASLSTPFETYLAGLPWAAPGAAVVGGAKQRADECGRK